MKTVSKDDGRKCPKVQRVQSDKNCANEDAVIEKIKKKMGRN